jgi:integrase
MGKKKTTTSGLDWNTMTGLCHRLKEDKLYRDYLLILCGSYFGLRISDLLELRWQDLLAKTEVILTEQKTGKERIITINPKVSEALKFVGEVLLKQDRYRSEGYIFANRWGGKITISYVNKRLKFIFSKYQVNVQNPSSHSLRKTMGKRVWEMDGKSERALIYLSEIFSHSSPSITKRYIGITEKQIADVYLKM